MGLLLLYVVFALSGISGLIYQVIWVRELGNAFGNTLHSASLVVAIFMLGLGLGSFVIGAWADRRYQRAPESLLRTYAGVEALIAALGLSISLALPHLGSTVAAVSSYVSGANGWYALTGVSYVARAALAVALLGPITMLMGGTLTLLIRYLVRADFAHSAWTVASLYGVNTAGAAAGAFLTDFLLVPAAGLFGTQGIAVGLNVAAAGGALLLARFRPPSARPDTDAVHAAQAGRRGHLDDHSSGPADARRLLALSATALALSGFGAMGIEILWLRHFTLLLGGFRSVFSLLVAVMLVALAIGAWFGGWLDRRRGRAAETLMIVQALFAVTVLAGLASTDAAALGERARVLTEAMAARDTWSRGLTELWYNARPVLIEVSVPALLAGFAFPLANAIAQRAEETVGRRAGLLYLANTAGAVGGSLAAGYLLLPMFGIQGAAAVLALTSALAAVPLFFTTRRYAPFAAAVAVAAVALVAWMMLPPDFLLRRSLVPQQEGERVLAISEGNTELIAVVERPGEGRGLLTNGHAMSSTAPLDQRYMRALAHIPLLSMARPARVLVIGFGVGNTTHAASLHPSVSRIDVVDLSRHVLEQADYFRDANGGVLTSDKVSVYLNDGRQHLQMTAPGTYDLVTLEPPPIAQAGVAALYSREFYALARSRLTPGGYISQWLPAYQVPADSSLAMVRAFIDVFPQSVLLSGTQAELLLVGTTGGRIQIDPQALEARIEAVPAVKADLERLSLDRGRDIVGMFVGSADTMRSATRQSPASTDDRPLQEYGVRSVLGIAVTGVPASLFDLSAAAAWCPRCFAGEEDTPETADLDLYFRLLEQAYGTRPGSAPTLAAAGYDRVLESRYLARVVPDSAEAHSIIAASYLRVGRGDDALRELNEALRRDPQSSTARSTLGQMRYEEGERLLDERRFADAAARFREAVALMPTSAEAHNNLGVALASTGAVEEAAVHFAEAVRLRPDFAQARENLAASRALAR